MADSSALTALRDRGPRLLTAIDNEIKRRKASFALRSLSESLQRLTTSYDEYKKAAQRYRLHARLNPTASPDAVQHALVDAHHAFHQRVYATLSTLALSLNQAKDTKATDYPTKNLTAFLTRLHNHDFAHRALLQSDITVLLKSTSYRAEYIDHPQQHQPRDWATYQYDGKEYIIYYGPFDKSRDPATIPHWKTSSQDPEHPNFRFAIDAPDWYVAPRVDKTYDALQRVIIAALKLT